MQTSVSMNVFQWNQVSPDTYHRGFSNGAKAVYENVTGDIDCRTCWQRGETLDGYNIGNMNRLLKVCQGFFINSVEVEFPRWSIIQPRGSAGHFLSAEQLHMQPAWMLSIFNLGFCMHRFKMYAAKLVSLRGTLKRKCLLLNHFSPQRNDLWQVLYDLTRGILNVLILQRQTTPQPFKRWGFLTALLSSGSSTFEFWWINNTKYDIIAREYFISKLLIQATVSQLFNNALAHLFCTIKKMMMMNDLTSYSDEGLILLLTSSSSVWP